MKIEVFKTEDKDSKKRYGSYCLRFTFVFIIGENPRNVIVTFFPDKSSLLPSTIVPSRFNLLNTFDEAEETFSFLRMIDEEISRISENDQKSISIIHGIIKNKIPRKDILTIVKKAISNPVQHLAVAKQTNDAMGRSLIPETEEEKARRKREFAELLKETQAEEVSQSSVPVAQPGSLEMPVSHQTNSAQHMPGSSLPASDHGEVSSESSSGQSSPRLGSESLFVGPGLVPLNAQQPAAALEQPKRNLFGRFLDRVMGKKPAAESATSSPLSPRSATDQLRESLAESRRKLKESLARRKVERNQADVSPQAVIDAGTKVERLKAKHAASLQRAAVESQALMKPGNPQPGVQEEMEGPDEEPPVASPPASPRVVVSPASSNSPSPDQPAQQPLAVPVSLAFSEQPASASLDEQRVEEELDHPQSESVQETEGPDDEREELRGGFSPYSDSEMPSTKGTKSQLLKTSRDGAAQGGDPKRSNEESESLRKDRVFSSGKVRSSSGPNLFIRAGSTLRSAAIKVGDGIVTVARAVADVTKEWRKKKPVRLIEEGEPPVLEGEGVDILHKPKRSIFKRMGDGVISGTKKVFNSVASTARVVVNKVKSLRKPKEASLIAHAQEEGDPESLVPSLFEENIPILSPKKPNLLSRALEGIKNIPQRYRDWKDENAARRVAEAAAVARFDPLVEDDDSSADVLQINPPPRPNPFRRVGSALRSAARKTGGAIAGFAFKAARFVRGVASKVSDAVTVPTVSLDETLPMQLRPAGETPAPGGASGPMFLPPPVIVRASGTNLLSRKAAFETYCNDHKLDLDANNPQYFRITKKDKTKKSPPIMVFDDRIETRAAPDMAVKMVKRLVDLIIAAKKASGDTDMIVYLDASGPDAAKVNEVFAEATNYALEQGYTVAQMNQPNPVAIPGPQLT